MRLSPLRKVSIRLHSCDKILSAFLFAKAVSSSSGELWCRGDQGSQHRQLNSASHLPPPAAPRRRRRRRLSLSLCVSLASVFWRRWRTRGRTREAPLNGERKEARGCFNGPTGSEACDQKQHGGAKRRETEMWLMCSTLLRIRKHTDWPWWDACNRYSETPQGLKKQWNRDVGVQIYESNLHM